MSNFLRKVIKELLLHEEIGRNFHTINGGPISYTDYTSYEVDMIPTIDGNYIVNIYYEDSKLVPTRTFLSKEEADLYARTAVEKHRLSVSD